MIEDNEVFTCQNPSCGITYSKPLRTMNLSLKQSEPYLACPYCLTETSSGGPSVLIESKSKQRTRKSREQIEQAMEEEMVESTSKPECTHHLGYLSERSKQDQIPEECMVCENIFSCMRKSTK